MNSKAYLPIGLMLMAVAGVWIAVKDNGRSLETAPAVSESALHEMPSGDKVTLQFFRNPAVVDAVEMKTLDGRTLSSASWKGKVTLVNFWATWCGPCRAEIPDLIALQKKYGNYMQVVGISQDEAPVSVVQEFVAAHQMNYPIVMSTPDLERAFPGINALPTSYLLNRDGRIVQKHVGMLTPDRTEQETRFLAGLPVNASIQEVDSVQRVALDEGAEVTSIPGIDLAAIPAEKRSEVLQKLNDENCTCGCELSVAKCRIDDPTCGVSLPMAKAVVKDYQ